MSLLILLFLLIPNVTFAQSGSIMDVGNTTIYNFGDVSGTRQSVGKTDFYNVSDGSSTTRNQIGNTDFYSGSTPSLSGSTNQIGGTTFGTWQEARRALISRSAGRPFTTLATGKTAQARRWGRIPSRTAIDRQAGGGVQ
ncbi:MAG: hypothetical protein ABIU05_11880 [Nitrospirales bacterium]